LSNHQKEDEMTLQMKLDEIRAGFKEKADPESLTLMERAAKELDHSGILDRVRGSGSRMPEFTLFAAQGGEVSSQKLLADGPLVLTFYRGVW
jgi:hypothetical protein